MKKHFSCQKLRIQRQNSNTCILDFPKIIVRYNYNSRFAMMTYLFVYNISSNLSIGFCKENSWNVTTIRFVIITSWLFIILNINLQDQSTSQKIIHFRTITKFLLSSSISVLVNFGFKLLQAPHHLK